MEDPYFDERDDSIYDEMEGSFFDNMEDDDPLIDKTKEEEPILEKTECPILEALEGIEEQPEKMDETEDPPVVFDMEDEPTQPCK